MKNMEREYGSYEQVELKKKVNGFETAKGSWYALDEDGRTTRFKTVENKEYPKSGVTVYLNDKFHSLISFLTYHNEDAKVRLLERRVDHLARIRDVSEIQNFDEVKLTFADKNNETEFIKIKDPSGGFTPAIFPVSFEPEVGSHPFEISYDQDNTKHAHYGNVITEIKYE